VGGRIDACSKELWRENGAATEPQFLWLSRVKHTGSTIMNVAVIAHQLLRNCFNLL
jgi:hypothetical protein